MLKKVICSRGFSYNTLGDLMKKICFTLFVLAALSLFVLFSCAKTDSLYDVLVSVTATDKSLPRGKILCYGRLYENKISDNTLSEYLGLEGYPAFKDKIEDFALYSSLSDEFSELCAIRLFSKDDIADAKLFFERRIKDIRRTLNFSGKEMPDAYIKNYGNTVILYIMKENDKYDNLIRKKV